MGVFHNQLAVVMHRRPRRCWDRTRWRVAEDLIYDSHRLRTIIVPAGTITDFASVPRLVFTFWLFSDVGHEAATVHDYLYETRLLPRATADAVFREALHDLGVARWRVWAMWAAVRVFGKLAWNRKRAAIVAAEPEPEKEEVWR